MAQNTIRDNFETYYTEKIWEMIPAIYRHEDGLAENPDVLRSIVEIIAKQAAVIRRSQDRLWEDQFVELCSNWAIPYIADLLGTRLVSSLNERGQRADVANTIAQRRRSGTLLVLEQIISRITDWEGTVKEKFRNLSRSRDGLDAKFEEAFDDHFFTPPGGTANLNLPRISELVDGPFDRFHHTPDFRQPMGKKGLFAIHKLAIHLYRLKAYQVLESTPFPKSDHPNYDGLRFTFDPSGRKIPLYKPRNRPESWDDWYITKEWELPGPISCRLLGDARYQIFESYIQDLIDNHSLTPLAAIELRTLIQQNFLTEKRFIETLDSLNNSSELLSLSIFIPLTSNSLIDECGKNTLLPFAVSVVDQGATVPTSQITAGNLISPVSSAPLGKFLIIDPEHGIFSFVGDVVDSQPIVNYHYGFSGPFGAGGYSRNILMSDQVTDHSSGGDALDSSDIPNEGILQIDDSSTYGPIANKLSVHDLCIQANNFHRPYFSIDTNWVLNTGDNSESNLILDGIWIGTSLTGNSLILRGDYEKVIIKNCTLDPGGVIDIFGNVINAVQLIIEANIDNLIIESSILGPISVQNNGIVETIEISDSIIQSVDETIPAIIQNLGETKIQRSTIFGALYAHRLYASEVIIVGHTEVNDTQNGCFRFSVTEKGSRIPRSYPHQNFEFSDQGHWFVSQLFGQPGYAQLSDHAPFELQRGAENGSEIGVFSSLINPIKLESLKAKIKEYMPFGLLPIFINET